MSYARQYTDGVGWENSPSTATPINATNLNQMDVAIQDVDEAVYDEFAAVYEAISQISGGGQVFSVACVARDVTVSEKVESQLVAITELPTNPNNNDLLFLQSSIDATYGGDASYGWILTDALQSQKSILMDASGTYTYKSNITAGNTIVLSYDPNGASGFSDSWRVRAVIPAASGSGGGSMNVFSVSCVARDVTVSEKVESQLVAVTELPANENRNDLLFLESAIDATYDGDSSYGWILTDALQTQKSILMDASGSSPYKNRIIAGAKIILSYDPNGSAGFSDSWRVRAVIPASGGGASTLAALTDTDITTPTDTQALKYDAASSKWVNVNALGEAYNFKIDSANNDTLIPVSMQRTLSKPFAKNDIIFLYMDTDGVFVPEEFVYRWKLQYTLDNTAVTGDIYDGLGNSAVSLFNTNLPRGTWLVLLCETYNSEYHTQNYTCIGKIDPASGASALSDLSDTNISTPSDGQFLKYDATSSKWINASGGGGGASSLADLSDTTISSPTAAQPLTYDATNSKWVNGGIIPAANGGTGNADGYIRTGRKANTNIGLGATAEGFNTTASGTRSHAEGDSTSATAASAHSEGANSTASGGSSHAEGSGTIASNSYAHSEGQGTKAQGIASHSEGFYSIASGNYSHASGSYTTAGYANQTAIGKYNNNKSTSLFEVGNGTASNAKSNALELDGSGNLTVAGDITDGNGNNLSALASYLEQTVTLSTSASTTVTFTDASITANSFIEYACSQWDLVPESITGAAGSCTIVLPKVDSAQSVTVRIYVR